MDNLFTVGKVSACPGTPQTAEVALPHAYRVPVYQNLLKNPLPNRVTDHLN
jgi:hypothetical protein